MQQPIHNTFTETWSPGIEFILEEIRLNSINMSEHHKEAYYYCKGYLKYFRIPTIILSGMNSVFSVGLVSYCPQQTVSLICCLISLICGIISSVELFLSIQQTMESELIASKDFYLLSVDVFKTLSLERNMRMMNGKTYLDETYQTYCKLIENSNIVSDKMMHMINPPKRFQLSPKALSDSKRRITSYLEGEEEQLIFPSPDTVIPIGINNTNEKEKEIEVVQTKEEREKEMKEKQNKEETIVLNENSNQESSNIVMDIFIEDKEKEACLLISDKSENAVIHDKSEHTDISFELDTKTKRKYNKKKN